MKIQLIIQILVLLGANFALALPVVNVNQVLNNSEPTNCQRTNQEKSFRDLIVKASVIGDDDRKPLSKNLDVVKFSAAEQEQAMRCTGHIFCPGRKGGRGLMQSAGMICPPKGRTSGGQCAPDRLGTVGHLFVDETTKNFIPQMDKCEFTNYRGHRSKLTISNVKNIISPLDNANNPHKNGRADKLAILLKDPVPGCDPFDIDESPNPPAPGTELVALTHIQADQAGKYDGSEPFAYKCAVTRSFAGRGGGPSMFYSDCDVKGGASGGFTLVRDSMGKLKVMGMFIQMGLLPDGQPYDESKKNFTLSVGTNADFLQLVAAPGVRPNPQLTQGETPKLRPASSK